MRVKLTDEQKRVDRLLAEFSRLPREEQEIVIGYTSGVADSARKYRRESSSDIR